MAENLLPPTRHVNRRSRLLVSSLLVFVTIVLTYPQAFRLGRAVGDHYDALFSIWRLSWIAHSLRHGTDLFDANIFYPERQTFAAWMVSVEPLVRTIRLLGIRAYGLRTT